jgi:hypothetical protein
MTSAAPLTTDPWTWPANVWRGPVEHVHAGRERDLATRESGLFQGLPDVPAAKKRS